MSLSLLIVVPTLNSFHLLPRLCRSLRHQTFTEWRVLFVDGNSSPAHRRFLDNTCSTDPRFSWITQSATNPGIFGAMNHGFEHASPHDWLLFWGSDDWASSSDAFCSISKLCDSLHTFPDLIICKGRYYDPSTLKAGRTTSFQRFGLFQSAAYRSLLFYGHTPPHQATIFSPGARAKLSTYSSSFRLSADLDYFLQISRNLNLSVLSVDLDLVSMFSNGVSGQQTFRRLSEVRRAYQRLFGSLWLFPFISRYFQRFRSLLASPL